MKLLNVSISSWNHSSIETSISVNVIRETVLMCFNNSSRGHNFIDKQFHELLKHFVGEFFNSERNLNPIISSNFKLTMVKVLHTRNTTFSSTTKTSKQTKAEKTNWRGLFRKDPGCSHVVGALSKPFTLFVIILNTFWFGRFVVFLYGLLSRCFLLMIMCEPISDSYIGNTV